MDLLVTSEYHINDYINIETIKTLGFIWTIFCMWIFHIRQVNDVKTSFEYNILKKIKKINKNQKELFTIVKNIDLFIHTLPKFKEYMQEQENQEDHEYEDDDSTSDYQP